MRRRDLFALAPLAACAQEPGEADVEFLCPMDKDVRSKSPGKCPRCGMALVAGLPHPEEFPVELRVSPLPLRPGREIAMRFRVLDPKTRKPVPKLEVVHEKLFHLFVISQDLEYFAHEHPEPQPDGSFLFPATLPRAGVYRLLCDFYPPGAVPQLVSKTLIVPGGRFAPAKPPADSPLAATAGGITARLVTEPAEPLAGKKTLCFFEFDGWTRPEPFLGAWAHLLLASADLIDLVHLHPVFAEGGPKMQFNIIFPRAGVHRLWLQIQNAGRVITFPLNVPVKLLS